MHDTKAKPQRKATRDARTEHQKSEEIIQTSFRLPRSRWTKLQQHLIEERLSVQAFIVAAIEAEFQRQGKTF